MQAIDGNGLKEAIKRARERWEQNKNRVDPPPQKGCEHCDYTGWVVKDGQRVRCECEEDEIRKKKQKTIDELVERYRIGVRGYTRTNVVLNWKVLPGQEGIRERLDRYVNRIRRGEEGNLVMAGSTGSGKTWAATYIMESLDVRKKLLEDSRYCTAISWGRVLSALKMTFKNEEEHHKILGLLYETEVLVIDDLGMEQKTTENYETSWSVSELYQMIDYRTDTPGRWTILTTNKPDEEIKKRFGDAFYSRVFNTSYVIRMSDDKDHRGERKPDRGSVSDDGDISVDYNS